MGATSVHTKELAYRWIIMNASLNDFTMRKVREVYDNKLILAWNQKANAKTLRGMCEWLSEGHTMFTAEGHPNQFKDETGKLYRFEFFHGYFRGSTIDFAEKFASAYK